MNNEELTEAFMLLDTRVNNLYKTLSLLIKELSEWSEFQTTNILEVKGDIYNSTRKTPWKRLDEMDGMIKGFISYHQEQMADINSSLSSTYKKNKYLYK